MKVILVYTVVDCRLRAEREDLIKNWWHGERGLQGEQRLNLPK